MNVTVAQALALDVFSEARVIAGKGGLSRPVHFVDIMEVPDPDKYFRQGILFVSSWYAIRDNVEAQCRLIQTAFEVGAAGFVLKVDRYLGQVSNKVLELADKLEIPIIDIAKDIPYIEITHPLLTKILHAQAFKLEHYFNIHKTFKQVAFESGGFDAIVQKLYSLLERPVAICDSNGQMLAWFPKENIDEILLSIGKIILDRTDLQYLANINHHTYRKLPFGSGELLVFPIRIESETYGYFLVDDVDTHCTESDFMALENACTIAAFEVVKRAAVTEVKNHFRHDFVYDLISGNLPSEKAGYMRAAALGWEFTPPVAVVVADIDGFADLIERQKDERQALDIKTKMLTTTKKTISAHSRAFIVANISDSCIAVAHLPKNKKIYDLLKELKRNLNNELAGVSVSIAASDPCASLLEVNLGYKEACELIEVSRKAHGQGRVAVREELDVYRLLYRSGSSEEMFEFYQKMLGPLEKYDRESGSELVLTLDRFLKEGAVIRTTARSLFIHENTLRYRLKKIEKVTSMDLKNPRHRFRLAMALHIAALL